MNGVGIFKRVIIYCLGMFSMGLGVSFTVIANLGIAPVCSIPYVVSTIIDGDLGMCTSVVFALFILIQIALLKKDFKMRYFLQVFSSSIYGFFISFAEFLTADLVIGNNIVFRILFCTVGIMFIALGVVLYMGADILLLPSEGVLKAMVGKFNLQLHRGKMIFDSSAVVISLCLSVIFLHRIIGIGLGTFMCAFGVGFFIKIVNIVFAKIKDSFGIEIVKQM